MLVDNHSIIQNYQAFVSGDAQAAEPLAESLAETIFVFASKYAPNYGLRWKQEDLEDFCQDTLNQLFKNNAKKLRSIKNPERFYGWLRTTVQFALIDAIRSKYEQQRRMTGSIHKNINHSSTLTFETLIASNQSGPDEQFFHREEMAAVRTLIAEILSESDQLLLKLWGSRLYSVQEIANILGITPATVSVKIHRAKRKLTPKLKELFS